MKPIISTKTLPLIDGTMDVLDVHLVTLACESGNCYDFTRTYNGYDYECDKCAFCKGETESGRNHCKMPKEHRACVMHCYPQSTYFYYEPLTKKDLDKMSKTIHCNDNDTEMTIEFFKQGVLEHQIKYKFQAIDKHVSGCSKCDFRKCKSCLAYLKGNTLCDASKRPDRKNGYWIREEALEMKLKKEAARKVRETKYLALPPHQPARYDIKREGAGWGTNVYRTGLFGLFVTAPKRYVYAKREQARNGDISHAIGEHGRIG